MFIFIGYVVIWIGSWMVGNWMRPHSEPFLGTVIGIALGVVLSILFSVGVMAGSHGKEDIVEPKCQVYSSSPSGKQIEHWVDCSTLTNR